MTGEQNDALGLKQWHNQAWRSLSRGSRGFSTQIAGIPSQGKQEGEEEIPTFFNSSFPILINFYPSNGFAQNMNHHISETVVTPIACTNQHNFIEPIPLANANFHVLVNGLVWKKYRPHQQLIFLLFAILPIGGWPRESALVKLWPHKSQWKVPAAGKR